MLDLSGEAIVIEFAYRFSPETVSKAKARLIIWRDELNAGKVFLRDIIDLEATYAGPDAKAMPTSVVIGPDGQLVASQQARALCILKPSSAAEILLVCRMASKWKVALRSCSLSAASRVLHDFQNRL